MALSGTDLDFQCKADSNFCPGMFPFISSVPHIKGIRGPRDSRRLEGSLDA